ncbi:hypothetical protein ACFOMH_00045 [Paracoccus mangrovi]|uniref:CTP synthetase n=1 Tax=Paracoccus mangrovi TaxID=1715645 RepID=A0ABV7QZ15_9RHOB
MTRLFMLLFSIAFTTLAGIGIVLVLVLGRYDAVAIAGAAAVGGLLALPVSWLVAKRMQDIA